MSSIAAEAVQHIEATPGVCGGKPRIIGTRIRVQDIAVLTASGQTPDEILAAYPHIKLADIYAALAFYYDHQASIDEVMEADAQVIDRMRITQA